MSKDDLSRKRMDDCGNYISKWSKRDTRSACLNNYLLLWWLLMHKLSLFYATKIKKQLDKKVCK
jgi:hypothetical protein